MTIRTVITDLRKLAAALALLALLCLPRLAAAKEYVCANDAQFAAALAAVEPGDRVYLKGGIYKQPVNMLRGGVAGQPVRLMPWGDERPIFTLPSGGQFVVNAAHVVTEGLTFNGGSCVRSMAVAKYCEFRNLTIRNMQHQGMSLLGEASVIEGCDISIPGSMTDNQAHCLYIAASGCTVRNNRLGTAAGGSALHLYPATIADCLVEDNYIEQWGGVTSAVMVCGQRHLFRRNTVRGHGVAALAFIGADQITFEDSDLRGFPTLVYDQYSTPEKPCNVTMRQCKLHGKLETSAGWKLTEQNNT